MKARTFAAYLVWYLGQIKGKKAFQKLVYLAKAMGISLKYPYEMHYYGPYSEAVAEELEEIYLEDIIDLAKDSNYIYVPGKKANEVLAEDEEEVYKNQEILKSLLQRFGGMSPRELEIYSTAHFVWKIQGIFGWSTAREDVLGEIKKAKYPKFMLEDIEAAYNDLVKWDLIEN